MIDTAITFGYVMLYLWILLSSSVTGYLFVATYREYKRKQAEAEYSPLRRSGNPPQARS